MPAPRVARRLGALIACVAVLLSTAACGDVRRAPPAPPSVPAPDSARQAARCFAPDVVPLLLRTDDRVRLAAVRLGAGWRGVVLVNEDGVDMCRWSGFARRWADAGYHVLTFDLRCTGASECGGRVDYLADTAAAVDELRRNGATRVVLVGASLGATVALVAGARHADRVDGVVALSPHSLGFRVAPAGGRPVTAAAAAGSFRIPLLLVQTERDPYAMPAGDAVAFVAAAPAGDRRLELRPGTAHGCSLLHTGAEIPDLVDGFLRRHTG